MGTVCQPICNPTESDKQPHPETSSLKSRRGDHSSSHLLSPSRKPLRFGELSEVEASDGDNKKGQKTKRHKKTKFEPGADSPSHYPHLSTSNGEEQQPFLDHAATIHSKDMLNEQFHRAIKAGNASMVTHYIEEYASIDLKNMEYKGQAPLHAAVRCGQHQILQILLDENANVRCL